MIPLSVPSVTKKEINLVKQTINKNWISTYGDYKNRFDYAK